MSVQNVLPLYLIFSQVSMIGCSAVFDFGRPLANMSMTNVISKRGNLNESPCCECVHAGQSGSDTTDKCCLCLIDNCPCGITRLDDHRLYCSPCNCKCGIGYDDKAHHLACATCNCPCGHCFDGHGNNHCCDCTSGQYTGDNENDKSPCCECVHAGQSGSTTTDECCLCLIDNCPCGITRLDDHRVYCSPCNCKCGIGYDDKAHLLACATCNCPCGHCFDGHGNNHCCDCSPPPSPPPAPPANGCFPSAARLTLENGDLVTMSELQVGDLVQTVSSTGKLMYSKVRTFLSKQHATVLMYKSITTSMNKTITLTGNHLIYGRKSFTKEFTPIYADQIMVGDEVLVPSNYRETHATVISVSTFIGQGAYVPVTKEGNIVVDEVLASCYANFDHDLAHFTMTPVQWFPETMEWIFGDNTKYPVLVPMVIKLGRLMSPYGQFFIY